MRRVTSGIWFGGFVKRLVIVVLVVLAAALSYRSFGDEETGTGSIVFSPLAQGVLTDKYLHGIPAGSRAARGGSLSEDEITDDVLATVRALGEIASGRGQTLAQMALAWVLRDPRVTSALVGASSVAQLEDNVAALQRLEFDDEELARIDRLAPRG